MMEQQASNERLALPVGEALVHVGVRKAASSYLQAWFANHLGCSYTTAPDLADQVLELVQSEEPLDSLLERSHSLPEFKPLRPLTSDRRFVISNEHFAMYAFGSDHFTETFCRRYLRLGCALLKQACPDARILIVTRGPEAWIKSAYNQYVRWPHRVRSFPVFLRKSWPYLRANTDYRFLRDLYAETFGSDRVLLLPHEWLNDDPNGFLERIESFAAIDRDAGVASGFDDRPRNVSLSTIETEKLRRLRTLMRLLHRKSPRLDHDNYLKNKILRHRFTIDEFLGDIAACFLYEPDPRVDRVLRLMLDRLPAPSQTCCERSIPGAKLAQLADQCRFLADSPEYRNYGPAYLFN